jgi:hypothetical protein
VPQIPERQPKTGASPTLPLSCRKRETSESSPRRIDSR